MLEKIEVSGFKSLIDFSLTLRPGLNILAGPNGSGKSNIILFFEFLSHLASGTAMQAVSRAGGAGTIFTHLGEGKLSQRISFSIHGVGDYRTRFSPSKKAVRRTMAYEYFAVIELHMELATLAFTEQRLRLVETETQQQSLNLGDKPSSLEVFWKNEKSHITAKVSCPDPGIMHPAYQRPGDADFVLEDFLSKLLTDERGDYPLFQVLQRVVDPVRIIHDDLVEGRAYNIDPNMVRQLADIASEPGIGFDGSGLAPTLFASKKAAQTSRASRQGPWQILDDYDVSPDLLEQVSSYARLINSNIIRVDVESHPLENKLRVWLFHRTGKSKQEIRMPISLASDGTVKWLALTTAVITRTSAFAIEEPENFLHPQMQTEIVNIVRNTSVKRKRMFALLTTHSETLLNAADPHEVIIVRMTDGRTRAMRPSNVDELQEEIRSTGFGLGYYYVAGALE